MVLIRYTAIHVYLLVIIIYNLVGENDGYSVVKSINEWRNRTRRQSDLVCRNWEFKCADSEKCIFSSKRCDGKVDCSDSSDESTVCRNEKCPSLSFRCNYGACISGKAQCDGKQDCADNSDENNCASSRPTTTEATVVNALPGISDCKSFQFACNNGQCIPRLDKCNGAVNCADGSDETAATCGKEMCPATSFRCKYGACLRVKAKCNGIQDCADNSDEDPQLCNYKTPVTKKPETITQRPPAGSCKIPNPPAHSIMRILGTERDATPGTYIPNNAVLTYKCKAGFVNAGRIDIIYHPCANGKLSGDRPINCLPTCPVRIAKTVIFTCRNGNNNVPCNEPLPDGTVMTMKCKPYHKKDYFSADTSICKDGKWDTDVISCRPTCGVRPNSKPLVIGGQSTSFDLHPWHAGVYKYENGNYKHICGGTLINSATVVSAAHCFTDPQSNAVQPSEDFMIAAGKNYRDLDDKRDINTIQKKQVKQIVVHGNYRGFTQSYRADIALIRIDDFELNNNIALACIDWESKFSEEIEDVATVVGWGVTELEGRPGDPHLKKLEVPIISREDCEKKAPQDFQSFITFDKYCAGNFDGTSVCTGDSGGGLITKDAHNYYTLRGITSTAPVKGSSCDNDQLATYTKISKYIDFIRKSNEWIS